MRTITALIGAWHFCAAALAAQTPRDTTPTVIRAGRVFDSEKGSMSGPQEILVVNGRITAVAAKVTAPRGARVVDLSKYTVLPGLIDAHTHLPYLENPENDLALEGVKAVTIEGTPLRALHGAARARTFLAAGITTVRDLGNSGRFGDVALRAAIRDGSVDGPRMVVSGPGLSPPGGQFPGVQAGYQSIVEEEYRIVRGPADAAAAVQENVSLGAGVIKIYSNNSPTRVPCPRPSSRRSSPPQGSLASVWQRTPPMMPRCGGPSRPASTPSSTDTKCPTRPCA